MREHLIALIRATQDRTRNDQPSPLRSQVVVGDSTHGILWFGYGYFDMDGVLYWPPGDDPTAEELSVEDGVDRFLASYSIAPNGGN